MFVSRMSMCQTILVTRLLQCRLAAGFGANDQIHLMIVFIIKSGVSQRSCHMRCITNAPVRISLRCIHGKQTADDGILLLA